MQSRAAIEASSSTLVEVVSRISTGTTLASSVRSLISRPARATARCMAVPVLALASVMWITSWVLLHAAEAISRAIGFRELRSSYAFQLAFGITLFVPTVLVFAVGTRMWQLGSST